MQQIKDPDIGQVWSIHSTDECEKPEARKKSKRTILICTLVLLAVTAALTTWVFVVRPSFFPKLKIATRNEEEAIDTKHHIERRSGDGDSEVGARKTKIHRKINVRKIFQEVKKDDFPYKSSRLPRSLLPKDYYVSLDVDLDEDTYKGNVAIELRCTEETPYFIFHSRKLNIQSIRLNGPQAGKELKMKRILFYEPYEMFLVEMEENLEEGRQYFATIEFQTKFNPYLAGFYKSQYRTKDGEFRTVATSHFEPTDARSAFPCLDEPNFKAKFHISIIHSMEYIALSNMPVETSRDVGDGRIEDTFKPSVQMSTYLVAFAVVDFKYKESETKSGIKVRVYAPESDYDRIDYAVHVGVKVISFYEKFFGAPYPLPKLDLLSVPDFLAGAMEDWGLVSFRSSYLIYDKDKVTLDQKKMITLVIAHELAHQWFGNLVTMKWWNDIWLNEGFANFVEMLGTNEVNPDFHPLDLQVPTGWHTAIALDSLMNSHPIDQAVDTPSEIDELFDAISYNKGAALLRMLRSFLGNDFIKGVKDYIQTHKFGNAETDDLWKHLKKADHTNTLEIKSIMDTWARQNGFPVLTIERENDDLIISQKSFLLKQAEKKKKFDLSEDSSEEESTDEEKPKDLKWHVHFTYVFDDSPEDVKAVWLNNETQIRVKAKEDFKWIKANMGSHGYYVVNYDKQTWHCIIRQLKEDHEVFSPVDRANIIHDAFKLGCDGIINPMIPLQLSKYLKKEQHYIPWAMARAKLDCMSLLIQNKKIKKQYKKYFWYLQSHLVDASVLDVDKYNLTQPLDVFQRFDTFSFALKNDFRKDFKTILRGYFEEMKNGVEIPGMAAELRALTLIFASDLKKDDDFDFMWKTYVKTPLDADRRFIMKAFSRVKDKKKLKIILDASLDDKKVRVQDTIPLMMTIVKTGGRKQVWEFIEKNFKKLAYRYGGRYQLGTLVAEVAGGFYKKADYERVKKFLSTHSLGKKGSRTERQVLEKMKNNLDKHTSSATDNRSGMIERWVQKQMMKIDVNARSIH